MVILLILFILILTLVASLVFRLMGISGPRHDKIDLCIENIRVRTDIDSASYIDVAVRDMRKSGLTPERIELTPNAYAWLCRELKVKSLTHVSGVPVKVIEPENAP